MSAKKKRRGRKPSGNETVGPVAGANAKLVSVSNSFPIAVKSITSVDVFFEKSDGTAGMVYFFVPRAMSASRGKSRKNT